MASSSSAIKIDKNEKPSKKVAKNKREKQNQREGDSKEKKTEEDHSKKLERNWKNSKTHSQTQRTEPGEK